MKGVTLSTTALLKIYRAVAFTDVLHTKSIKLCYLNMHLKAILMYSVSTDTKNIFFVCVFL